jgi:hypothetical protein
MDNQITTLESTNATIDCACVIHGDAYDWIYVDRLFNMLTRHMSQNIRFHVYTEADRPVPANMIKHALPAWGIRGAKSSWWYKMKLFDSSEHAGPLLYFDLDTVIVKNIDWICKLPPTWFWTIRDFKYLWRPTHYSINSSIMWWDTRKFDYVWKEFQQRPLQQVMKQYRGDQDYLTKTIENSQVRYLDSDHVKSWRWECLDGGYNFKRRNYQSLGTTTIISPQTDILVFHGHPKPAELQDSVVLQHWK